MNNQRAVYQRLWREGLILAAIAAVSALHYSTSPHAHSLHDIYRRLYYLPIIVAAFNRGLTGGVVAAIVVCLFYLPHALGHISHDPATDTQKALEMFLYLAVGLVTGLLVSRLKRTQRDLYRAAADLRGSIEQLRSTEQQLIQTARLAAVGRLSAGLAHEIRNPLASIKGSAELLVGELPPDHPKHRLFEVLIEESVRLNTVLTRFLSFARPRPLEESRFDARGEITTVVSLLQTQDPSRNVRFHLNGGGETPVIRGDRDQLRQVFLNVLLNACQAAGVDGRVEISWIPEPDSLRIVVRDSGPGFSAEALENAFTPFFTTKAKGTGLGLAESHRIVEAHGGRIVVGNHGEGGGVVEIQLPLLER